MWAQALGSDRQGHVSSFSLEFTKSEFKFTNQFSSKPTCWFSNLLITGSSKLKGDPRSPDKKHVWSIVSKQKEV